MNVFGAIPLPGYENGYDQVLSRQKSQNSLKEQELRNKYYGPNIESEMANRNALTQGYNINNQYAPERLGLANKQAQQNLEWNPRNWASENALRNSNTNRNNQILPYEIQKQILDNKKAQMEYSREKEFEDNFKNFTNQNRSGNTMPVNQNNMYQYTPINPNSMNPQNQNISGNINPQNNVSYPSISGASQQANPNEQIVSPGSSQLSGIDEWYENNPIHRSLLEKKGFKKNQQIKVDKSGKATLVTKYPSGKITVSSMGPNSTDENGIPLTNKMISQHQNVVASVDVAIPVLDKIISMKDNEYSRFGGWTNKGAKYAGEVSQALDSLLGAFGLPQTNEGIKTIREQLEIGHNESPKAYRKRIEALKEDILKRQKYSSGLVKKAIKISGNENENDPYNLDSYDSSGG